MKSTAISIVIAAILIAGAIMLAGGNKNTNDTGSQNANNANNANNVTIVDGKQIITIDAKGGYSPRVTTAKAGIPTVIKVATNGTFDCSSALTIPSISYQSNLPPSGETAIDVPSQQAGTSMKGLCAMGMYNFAIKFN